MRWHQKRKALISTQHCIFNLLPPQSQVPAHLCTSPIPLEAPEELEETVEGSSMAGSGARRKKRRRKRMRSDSHLRDEVGSSSDERERERESEQALQESPAKEGALHVRCVK